MTCTAFKPITCEVFMKQRQSSLHFLPDCRHAIRDFRRGISLHGHTQHSRESLGFINRHIDTIPLVANVARHAMARYQRDHGHALDFNRAYWTAPLTAGDAFDLERTQIENLLGLEGTVSMTDHDNIDAALGKLKAGECSTVVSLEWTVPYPPAYFHVGVHNLPAESAPGLTARMQAFTQSPKEGQLAEILAALDQIPDVLVVLNHPFWEMEPIGKARLHEMLHSFLRIYGRFIHALEVSGLRPWKENLQAMELAEILGMAVVSGGDRHGWEANTMLNVTRAATFSEFVAEVRGDGQSEIVVTPGYHREPFGLRMMQVAWDVLREYPAHSCGRTHWTDRVFFQCDDGDARPLSHCFERGEPRELRVLTGAMRQIEKQPWRALLHAAWTRHSTHAHLPPPPPRPLRPAIRPVLTGGEGSVA